MRIAVAALALLAGCSSNAQAACRYDLYIYQPHNGPQLYAVSGEGRSAAIAVRGCGDVSFVPDAADTVAQLQARRERGELDVVTVDGGGGRTILGGCGSDEEEEDHDEDEEAYAGVDDEENLVFVRNSSAAQMRRTLQTLRAAPRDVREQLIEAMALRTCR